MRPTPRLVPILAALALGLGLGACGGHASNPGDDTNGAGQDAGDVRGKACGIDKGQHWSAPFTVSAPDDQVLFEPPSMVADKAHHLYIGYTSAPGSAGQAGSRYWDARVGTVDICGASPVVAHRARVTDDQGGCFQHFHVKFLGDYFGFIVDGSKLRISWSDPRNGTESQVFCVGEHPQSVQRWALSVERLDSGHAFAAPEESRDVFQPRAAAGL